MDIQVKTNKEVHSRIAHLNGYDEEGIYFRTMYNKPFCRQLMKTKKVCTFKAIKEGNPYEVIGERCDDCGSCMQVCPVEAIDESLTF